MAITLEKRFSVNVGQIVQDAIDSVKSVQKGEQARYEAEFQRAVADGLSYEDQIKLREAQLEQAKSSGFTDESYVSDVTAAIASTKRLLRFQNYRSKYSETLGDLNSGRINEEQYLDTLKKTLEGVEDTDLRTEILGDIASAEQTVKTYKDTILNNRVKKAVYDGTEKELNRVIKEVKSARASAKLSKNEDEVSAYDETLASLEGQLSTAQVEDAITDYQASSATKGTDPLETLDYINGRSASADDARPIRIGNKTYDSAQQFWNLERDSYLAGTSQEFGNFFDELKNDVATDIASSVSKFGYPTVGTLDSAVNTFSTLAQRPEIQPFINRLEATRIGALDETVRNFSDYIVRVGSQNLDFNAADALLSSIEQKTGVSTADYKVLLRNQNISSGQELEDRFGVGGAADRTVTYDMELPGVGVTPPPPVAGAPVAAPGVSDAGASRVVKQGDTLSGIATETGINLNRLLELNPQYKANPNLIIPGQQIRLPSVTTATATPPPVTPKPTVKTPAPAPVKTEPVMPQMTDIERLTKIKEIAEGVLKVQQELDKGVEPPKTK